MASSNMPSNKSSKASKEQVDTKSCNGATDGGENRARSSEQAAGMPGNRPRSRRDKTQAASQSYFCPSRVIG